MAAMLQIRALRGEREPLVEQIMDMVTCAHHPSDDVSDAPIAPSLDELAMKHEAAYAQNLYGGDAFRPFPGFV